MAPLAFNRLPWNFGCSFMTQRHAKNQLFAYSNLPSVQSTIDVTAHPSGETCVSSARAVCTFCDFKGCTRVY